MRELRRRSVRACMQTGMLVENYGKKTDTLSRQARNDKVLTIARPEGKIINHIETEKINFKT